MKIGDMEIYLRASGISSVMSGTIGLTDKQEERLTYLNSREKLTENMAKERGVLTQKKENSELPEGVKTYLNELVLTGVYGVQKDIESKYTAHGVVNEPHSIMYLNAYLNALCVDRGINPFRYEKNTKRITKEELFLTGEVDVKRDNYVLDVKNPFDPFTMGKHRKTIIKDYFWQGMGYCALYEVDTCYFAYTLNEHMYMEENQYSHLSFLERTYIDKVVFDKDIWQTYIERIPMIKKYIKQSVKDYIESQERTKTNILEIIKLES